MLTHLHPFVPIHLHEPASHDVPIHQHNQARVRSRPAGQGERHGCIFFFAAATKAPTFQTKTAHTACAWLVLDLLAVRRKSRAKRKRAPFNATWQHDSAYKLLHCCQESPNAIHDHRCARRCDCKIMVLGGLRNLFGKQFRSLVAHASVWFEEDEGIQNARRGNPKCKAGFEAVHPSI